MSIISCVCKKYAKMPFLPILLVFHTIAQRIKVMQFPLMEIHFPLMENEFPLMEKIH